MTGAEEMIAPERRDLIEEFLLDCAHDLDDDRLESWPGYFTEDAVYRILPRESHERDLPLLAAMGANALRVYHFDWGGGQSHARFFNACAAHNITVMGGFELHAHPASAR